MCVTAFCQFPDCPGAHVVACSLPGCPNLTAEILQVRDDQVPVRLPNLQPRIDEFMREFVAPPARWNTATSSLPDPRGLVTHRYPYLLPLELCTGWLRRLWLRAGRRLARRAPHRPFTTVVPAAEPEPVPEWVHDVRNRPQRERPETDLRSHIYWALRGYEARIDTELWPLVAALFRVLEYHRWHYPSNPAIREYCEGCGLAQQRDDGRDYLAGLPCPELAAIGSALGLTTATQ